MCCVSAGLVLVNYNTVEVMGTGGMEKRPSRKMRQR